MKKIKFIKGQSMFEVVFAIGIIALITVAIVSVSTIAIRNNVSSKNKSLSTKYVDEAMEWLRSDRDSNWGNFKAHGGNNMEWNIFCADTLPPDNWGPNTDRCDDGEYIPGTTIYREFSLARESQDVVHAKVEVRWTDAQGMHSTSSYTVFTAW